MQREKTADRALGQWRGILSAIGLPSRALANKHGPCPICGGKDRFRFDDKNGRGTWICSQCGAGDGVSLVMAFLRIPFRDAVQRIDAHIGEAVSYTPKGLPAANDDMRRREIQALWARACCISEDDHAGRYLRGRCGLAAFPSALRYVSDEQYSEAGQRPSFYPAMVAKVDPSDEAAAAGERAAIHRTYLSPIGGKAEVRNPRKMLGTMPTGAAVRLAPVGDVLGIAEGIETALSASALFGMPCWAALTAGLLELWWPPAGVRTVFIFGDNDASFTGQAAAYKLAQRLKARQIEAVVELPPTIGRDWNDVHQQRLEVI